MFLRYISLLLSVCILAVAVTVPPTKTLSFECYPNTTLKVENPGNFRYVHANNSVTACTTTWSADNSSVYINGCGMDDDILVFFSNLEPEFKDVIGGKTRESYAIDCKQIPATGVGFTVGNGMQVGIGVLEQSTYANFDPDLDITSGIYVDSLGLSSLDEAEVGTPLFWLIRIKSANYRVRPDECWAYSGKNIIDTVPKRKIYDNGCVVDDQLVGTFHKMGSGAEGRRSLIHTFRFYGSDYITFLCKVRVCPMSDSVISFCDSNECDTDRKKRDSQQSLNGKKEVTVTRTLRVLDEFYYSSTSNGVPNVLLTALSLAVYFSKYNIVRL